MKNDIFENTNDIKKQNLMTLNDDIKKLMTLMTLKSTFSKIYYILCSLLYFGNRIRNNMQNILQNNIHFVT